MLRWLGLGKNSNEYRLNFWLNEKINWHSSTINFFVDIALDQKKTSSYITTYRGVWDHKNINQHSIPDKFLATWTYGATVKWRVQLQKIFNPDTTSIEKRIFFP